MTSFEVIGLNNSPSDYQMVLYVGGITSSVKDVVPLAWQVIPFAARTTSGPTRIVATWTVKFGFTLMMKGKGNVVYSSSQIWDDFPLGSTLTISYNKNTGTYSGTPGEGGEPGSLTFILGGTLPPVPTTTTIGITMNGKAIGAVDPARFLPNTKIVFYVTPRYTVNAAYSLIEGQDVNAVQMVTTPLSIPFPDGIVSQTAQLSFDNRWSLKSSFQPQGLAPSPFPFCPSSIQISTYGSTVINIQNYPLPLDYAGASPKNLPAPSPKPALPAPAPARQAWIFSDDLSEAHPVSIEAGALLAAVSPNVLVLVPDGDIIDLDDGEDQVKNIPETTDDNRESPWIKFWNDYTGLGKDYTCVVNDDCGPDRVGAHVYVKGKGEQWYITCMCKKHNHYTRTKWQDVGIDTQAVPISTYVAAVLKEFYARKAQSGHASVAEILQDMQRSNGKQKQGFLLQQIN